MTSLDRDAPWIAGAAKQDITRLSAEILRLSRLPYRSWRNLDHIRSLDKQIQYLEEVLAAFERDYKKHG